MSALQPSFPAASLLVAKFEISLDVPSHSTSSHVRATVTCNAQVMVVAGVAAEVSVLPGVVRLGLICCKHPTPGTLWLKQQAQ